MVGVGGQRVIGEGTSIQAFFEAEAGPLVMAELVAGDRDAAGRANHKSTEEVAAGGAFAQLAAPAGVAHQAKLTVIEGLAIFQDHSRAGIVGVNTVSTVRFAAVIARHESGTVP